MLACADVEIGRPFVPTAPSRRGRRGPLLHPPGAWRIEAVARSEAAVGDVLADGGLDCPLAISDWTETPNLRWMVVAMIEEESRVHVSYTNGVN